MWDTYSLRRCTSEWYLWPRNFLKREIIDIPEGLNEYFPNQGIRLAAIFSSSIMEDNYDREGIYNNLETTYMPAMIEVYLVNRNGREPGMTFLEVLGCEEGGEYVKGPRGAKRRGRKLQNFEQIRFRVEKMLPEILADYLGRNEAF